MMLWLKGLEVSKHITVRMQCMQSQKAISFADHFEIDKKLVLQ
jgi:hypothetical protein